MIDLSTLKNEPLYEIKLLDGKTYTLKRPTQAIQQFLVDLSEMKQADQMQGLAKIFVRILNRNTQGETFTLEKLGEEYGYEIMAYVIKDYSEYWAKSMTDINFQVAQ